jgi:hypothetical protein
MERHILGIVCRTVGDATDVQPVLFHRPEFFGRPLGDLAQIGFTFCLINRVADSLAVRVPPAELFARTWPTMRDQGYRF